MIRKLFRRGLRIGAVVGAILFLVQLFLRRQQPMNEPDTSGQTPARPSGTTGDQKGNGQTAKSTATTTKTVEKAWAEPVEGTCPDGYPVKAKIASGIFHVPGGMAYDRTSPDRCYRDAAAAEADGYRPAKR